MGPPRDASPVPSRRILASTQGGTSGRGGGKQASGASGGGRWTIPLRVRGTEAAQQEEASLGQLGDPRANFLQLGLALFGVAVKKWEAGGEAARSL